MSRALRFLAAGAVAAGVAAPLLRHRLKLPRPVVSAMAWQAPYALTVAVPRTRLRDAGVYLLQMLAYVAHYEMPNDDPEALLRRLKIDYPIAVDRALGAGVPPTVRLQRTLGGGEGVVRRHDLWLSWVHWSWFFFPHTTAAYILWRWPERFPRAAGQIAATFDLGCVVYWAVPTAPPWWAAKNGNVEPVRRIMVDAGEHYWGRLWRPLYDSLAGNPLAAMPSLHFGTSVMAAHVLSDVGRGHGAAGWGYTAALGFALVYLGEHYVVDLLAGATLAEAVRLGARRL